MSKYLKVVEGHFDVKAPEKAGRDITSVVDMFNYYLSEKKVSTGQIEKIVILFDAAGAEPQYQDDVCIWRTPFPAFDRMNAAGDSAAKRKVFIETFVAILKELFTNKWDTAPLDEVLQLLDSKGYRFEEYWKKGKWNAAKVLQAKIYWTLAEELKVYFHIFDRQNTLLREQLIVILPSGTGALLNTIGDLAWEDNITVKLLHRNKKDYWTFNTETGTLSFYFERAEKGDAHGQYDLGMMYLEGRGVLPDREQGKHWLQKAAAQQYGKAAKKLAEL